jgi:hypothetical protein
MPRKRNPIGIAAGKLILAIQNELGAIPAGPAAIRAQRVLHRARTLLQASESSSVPGLLDGRSVVEYLDSGWVETHPSVEPGVAALVAALSADEKV